jgi:hypothetical protein
VAGALKVESDKRRLTQHKEKEALLSLFLLGLVLSQLFRMLTQEKDPEYQALILLQPN